MIISEDIFNFITETEDEFVTNLLEGEEEEIKNFAETLPFLENIDFNNKSLYLDAFKKIKAENMENHSLVYEQILKSVSLTILDKNWHNHIQELNNIRLSVSLSGYGGKDPVNEFRKASFGAFNQLIYEIQKQMVLVLNNMNIQNKDQNTENKMDDKILNPKKIGRNEPCPCGSKKKYKHCHGKVSLG
jgi:preprotein translocase subunit SecA